MEDEHIKWASGSVCKWYEEQLIGNERHHSLHCADVAAARTTMATTGTFLLSMILHPDIQAKAQAELDRETGGDRLPTLAE